MKTIHSLLENHNYELVYIKNIQYVVPKMKTHCNNVNYITYEVIDDKYVGQRKIQTLNHMKYNLESPFFSEPDASAGTYTTQMVNKLNTNYNRIQDATSGDWFPANSGVFLSAYTPFGDTHKTKWGYEITPSGCISGTSSGEINIHNRLLWCPPSVDWSPQDDAFYQSSKRVGRITSFSYIRADLPKALFPSSLDGHNWYLIYDNTTDELVKTDRVFCMWSGDGVTGDDPDTPCEKQLAINCFGRYGCDTKPIYTCSGDYPCHTFKQFITQSKVVVVPPTWKTNYTEVLIKSWNYDPSGPSGTGILKQGTPEPQWDPNATAATFGWSDNQNYHKPNNIPLLAIGIQYDDLDKGLTTLKTNYTLLKPQVDHFNNLRHKNKQLAIVGINKSVLTAGDKRKTPVFIDLSTLGIY